VLKGFVKVKDLQPGESREVNYTFKDEHFSFWDVNSASWKIDAGEYKIMVGSSSRDIRLNTVIELS
jgi:beta-glucosidase